MIKHVRDNRRMNIKQTVRDLLATGLTQHELAALVPCSQSLIAAFAAGTRGKQPSMLIGNSLVRLHQTRCGALAAGVVVGAALEADG